MIYFAIVCSRHRLIQSTIQPTKSEPYNLRRTPSGEGPCRASGSGQMGINISARQLEVDIDERICRCPQAEQFVQQGAKLILWTKPLKQSLQNYLSPNNALVEAEFRAIGSLPLIAETILLMNSFPTIILNVAYSSIRNTGSFRKVRSFLPSLY